MNKQSIEQAHDTDLRYSLVALHRAALRARELAMKTGTAIVVTRKDKLEYFVPNALTENSHPIQEPPRNHDDKI